MTTISTHQIDLWVTPLKLATSPEQLARFRELLSQEEREREPSLPSKKEQERYVVTRALERTVLSRYANVAPSAWRFTTNAHGRPELANFLDEAKGLCYNISHTSEFVVLAVSEGKDIGVDAEGSTVVAAASIEMAEVFFAPSEVARLNQVDDEWRTKRFVQTWTLKESYLKARGLGLTIPLDQFSFDISVEGEIGFATEPSVQDDPQRWRFWQLKLDPNGLIAVCAERNDGGEQVLVVQSIVPLEEPGPLEYRMLAHTVG